MMSVSDKVKAVLALSGKKQVELAEYIGTSKQVLSNKMARDSWSGRDLATVAEFCGGKLAFVLPNGQQITIEKEERPDA
jgi:hypothetical protein